MMRSFLYEAELIVPESPPIPSFRMADCPLRGGKRKRAEDGDEIEVGDDDEGARGNGQASDQNRAPTFPQFMSLPAELRAQVWQMYQDMAVQAPHPLRVRLYQGYERVWRNSQRTTHKATLRLTAMPDLGPATVSRRTMLQICREARYEFMRRWRAVLELDKGGLLRFDPDKDVIFLDIRNGRVIEDLIRLRSLGICPAFAAAIRHIGFDMTPQLPHWSLHNRPWLDPRLDFILCFPNLHSISLISFETFDREVDWENSGSVAWFLARSRSHDICFRGFPAIEGVDYLKQSLVGTRTAGHMMRHNCVICTIHKCVYVRDYLRNMDIHISDDANIANRPILTDAENTWLAGLTFHTLLATTPQMSSRIRPYRGWLNPEQQAGLALNNEEDELVEEQQQQHMHDFIDDDDDDDDDDDHDFDDEGDDELDYAHHSMLG